MISEESNHLLFIEPDRDNLPSVMPTNDDLVRKTEYIMSFAKPQDVNFMGRHTTRCGKDSTSHNLDLPFGFVTNSLAVYYVKHYRLHIPAMETLKILSIHQSIVGSIKYPLVQTKAEQETLRQIKNTKQDILLSDRIRFNELVDSPICPETEVLLFMKEIIDRNV